MSTQSNDVMNRRQILLLGAIGASIPFGALLRPVTAKKTTMNKKALQLSAHPEKVEPFSLDDIEWQARLNSEQYRVLRKEGTERAFTSDLYEEKRQGEYACAGCGLALFTSEGKYNSGTGWPSFYQVIEGRVNTKRDFKLVFPRTEYHCARCDGHQGHIFKDGPKPTGLRYCNNGVALTFIPQNTKSTT